MRTTLNIPDQIIKDAKMRAVEEGKTLTDLLVEGLRLRLGKTIPIRTLPVSSAEGGLLPGVDWKFLESEYRDAEEYR